MKKQSRVQRITRWLTHFIELQLFLSLISLPLLIAWGLPISLLTPVANLIFNPVLTAFLFVSSLLFFTELVGIPNGLLVWCLDVITTWWTWVLDWYQNSWLIGFVKPSLWVLILIPVISLIIIACKKVYSSHVTITAMCVLFGVISITLYLQSRMASGVNSVAFNNDEVPILHYAQKTVVIDSGVIGKRASAVSWVNYTLVPELIKKTGRLIIDHLIVMQPSIRTFEALAALSVKVQIKNIYLPVWSGAMPRGIWRHYFSLCERIKSEGGSVIRITEYTRTITLSDEFIVYIQPLDTQLKYNEASFRAWSVHGQIDKQPFAFYAAKYLLSRRCVADKQDQKNNNHVVVTSKRKHRRKGVSNEEESVVGSGTRRLPTG